MPEQETQPIFPRQWYGQPVTLRFPGTTPSLAKVKLVDTNPTGIFVRPEGGKIRFYPWSTVGHVEHEAS